MKIIFISQNNDKYKKQKLPFKAGLTPKIMQEIQQADVLEISNRLARKGMPTDFKENKVIAWCCDKTVEIIEQLNKRFGTKLALPKGIFVEDFERLNVNNPTIMGLCNPFSSDNLIKNSNVQISGETLFFNTFETLKSKMQVHEHKLYDWENIDNIADFNYAERISATDYFLDVFMHEFLHIAHKDRLLNKIGEENLEKSIDDAKNEIKIKSYRNKYGGRIVEICDNALTSPFEAVACDMSRTIVSSLDKDTLKPTRNPFIATPYENLPIWKRIIIPYYTDEERPLKEILRNFWNGKFE